MGCADCWDLGRSQMLAADVNGDGRDDIVGVYDYGGGLMGMWNFVSDGTNFSTLFQSNSGCKGCWELSRSRILPRTEELGPLRRHWRTFRWQLAADAEVPYPLRLHILAG